MITRIRSCNYCKSLQDFHRCVINHCTGVDPVGLYGIEPATNRLYQRIARVPLPSQPLFRQSNGGPALVTCALPIIHAALPLRPQWLLIPFFRRLASHRPIRFLPAISGLACVRQASGTFVRHHFGVSFMDIWIAHLLHNLSIPLSSMWD